MRAGGNFVRIPVERMTTTPSSPSLSSTPVPRYGRIVLKLSGESLQGAQGFGIHAAMAQVYDEASGTIVPDASS